MLQFLQIVLWRYIMQIIQFQSRILPGVQFGGPIWWGNEILEFVSIADYLENYVVSQLLMI